MVQVFNATPTPSSASMIGSALGTGLSRNIALSNLENSMQSAGNDPMKLASAFMRAGMAVPGSERFLGQMYEHALARMKAQNSQNAPFGFGGGGNAGQGMPGQEQANQPQSIEQNEGLNNFLNPPQENPFFPSNTGDQGDTGNLPQAATSGRKERIASNKELLDWSKPYAAQKTAANIPTTPQEALQELTAINNDKKEANRLVEEERKERVASQREYGNIAQQQLSKVMPDAGPEETAYIKKNVEELAGENASEADIERLAAGEARKYKNMISSVEKDIPAIRSYNRPFQDLMGTSKSAKSARDDLRVKIQPLLDAGLYDKARNVLSERGYAPEEREMIISDLGEKALKNVSKMPKLPTSMLLTNKKNFEEKYNKGVNDFKNNLFEVLKSDPNVNPVLLRRKYELEKNVDWRLFKDSLNEAIDQRIWKPNDDQFNQLKNLDQPPLNTLDKLLHGFGLTGR